MTEVYTPFQWILFFYIYSVCGWVFESSYVSLLKKKWTNRGFLRGPFLPIYGSGAVMMLFVSQPFRDNLILTFVAGMVGATLLELVTGMVLEALFKVKYWDYSNQKYNYKGYICLSSSLVWGFFTVAMNLWLHPLVLDVLAFIPDVVEYIGGAIVTVLFVADTITSVREAFDLRDALIQLENMRKEAELLRRRMDVVMAVADEDWREFVEKHPQAERFGEMYRGLELRFEKLKNELSEKIQIQEEQKKELEELRLRFTGLKEKVTGFRGESHVKLKKRMQHNPTMSSVKYAHSLEMLRLRLRDEAEKKEAERRKKQEQQ